MQRRTRGSSRNCNLSRWIIIALRSNSTIETSRRTKEIYWHLLWFASTHIESRMKNQRQTKPLDDNKHRKGQLLWINKNKKGKKRKQQIMNWIKSCKTDFFFRWARHISSNDSMTNLTDYAESVSLHTEHEIEIFRQYCPVSIKSRHVSLVS